MNYYTAKTIDHLLTALINLSVILATGYVVFALNQSGWWFLLAMAFMHRPSKFKEEA